MLWQLWQVTVNLLEFTADLPDNALEVNYRSFGCDGSLAPISVSAPIGAFCFTGIIILRVTQVSRYLENNLNFLLA